MLYKTTYYRRDSIPLSGRLPFLLLIGMLAIFLAGCGGGNAGNNGIASKAAKECVLTQEQLDNLTPDDVDSLPKGCDGISFFDVPTIDGLFILGTEIDIDGNLKLYVHGVKSTGQAMRLADFQAATVTLDGGSVAFTVAPAPAGVLSMALLADYSTSIRDADLNGLGDVYDTLLGMAPANFESVIVNFSNFIQTGLPAITVKPEPSPFWTENLPALMAANNVDPAQARNNTTLYDAMGIGLLGPFGAAEPPYDGLGLVERGRPAKLLVVHTDGRDNSSLTKTLGDITALIERCHSVVLMLGTFQSEVDAQVLEDLAGARGTFANALNTNFLAEAVGPYADSLGELVVFTLAPATLFAGKTVQIDVGTASASEVEPFDLGAGCQV